MSTKSTIKGYFNTGDTPTEAQFQELFDEVFRNQFINKKDFDLQYVYVSDVLTTSPNWRSKRIDGLSVGEEIHYRLHSATDGHLITFFSSGDIQLSKVVSTSGDTSVVQTGVAVAPPNTSYAIVTTFKAELDDSHYSVIDNLMEYVLLHESSYGVGQVMMMPFNDAGVSFDVIIAEVLTPSPNWRSVNVTMSGGQTIWYELYSTGTTTRLLSFYDSGDTLLQEVLSANVATTVKQTGSMVAPENTSYVKVTTHATQANVSAYRLSGNIHDGLLALEKRLKDVERLSQKDRIITVDTFATADDETLIFNTIAAALDVAQKGDTIYIMSGTYSEYSLSCPEDIRIVGVGNVTIQGELANTATTLSVDATSTIDMDAGGTLENLTVTAKNMRYPIHADPGTTGGNRTWNIINCRFIHYGNQEVWDYRDTNTIAAPNNAAATWRATSAWGGGTFAGDKVNIKGCYFESDTRAFSTHNNVDQDDTFGASVVTIEDSEMVSHGKDFDGTDIGLLSAVHIQNLASDSPCRVNIKSSILSGYITYQGTGATMKLKIDNQNIKEVWHTMGGNSKTMGTLWSDLQDDLTYYTRSPDLMPYKNTSGSTISRGKAVKRNGIGVELMTSSDAASDFVGVAMEDIPSKDTGNIKTSGFIPRYYLDGMSATSVSDGDDISVDSGGGFVKNSTLVVATGVDNENVQL